jgi:hypothetical protein
MDGAVPQCPSVDVGSTITPVAHQNLAIEGQLLDRVTMPAKRDLIVLTCVTGQLEPGMDLQFLLARVAVGHLHPEMVEYLSFVAVRIDSPVISCEVVADGSL